MATERNAQGVDVLGEVLALLAKATPGEWRAASDGFPSVEADGAPHLALCNDASIPMAERRANSRLTAAAVNYLRSHGPAVAELIAADKEYDAALGLVRQTEATHGKRSAAAGRARAVLDLANERRALALSNIEGGQ